MTPRFALIGPGKVGAAIAKKALLSKMFLPVGIIGRDLAATQKACSFIGCNPKLAATDLQRAAKADLILLAVPDDSIGVVAHQLQHQSILQPDAVLLHFSGTHPAAIMRYPGSRNRLFSLHPLLPFASSQQAFETLNRAPCIGEGDEGARLYAAKLCKALGGQLQEISPDRKKLYHAAACMASNYLVTLTAAATELLSECGFDRDQGEALLLPLLEATLENIAVSGTKHGLTGPIVRGDAGTIEAHLEAIKHSHTGLIELYCLLGGRTVRLAEDSGRLNSATAQRIRQLLRMPFNEG